MAPGQLADALQGVYLSMAPLILEAGAGYAAASDVALALADGWNPTSAPPCRSTSAATR